MRACLKRLRGKWTGKIDEDVERRKSMIGAIIGDIVGSRFEFNNHLSKDFDFFHPSCEFTDDTVMTCAVAQALMDCKEDYSDLSEKTVAAM